jgi:homoaconitate hydratase
MSPKLNLIEKILAHAVVGSDPLDHVGQTILIRADWVITSELAWATMSKTYDELGRPPLPRPERFWLAADHAVDPRVNHLPKGAWSAQLPAACRDFAVRKFIELAEDIASREKGIDYQPPNTTILHTDFCRERVQRVCNSLSVTSVWLTRSQPGRSSSEQTAIPAQPDASALSPWVSAPPTSPSPS